MYMLSTVAGAVFLSIFFPIIYFITGIVISSLLDKMLFIRKFYIKLLLNVFKCIQKNIDDSYRSKRSIADDEVVETEFQQDNTFQSVVYYPNNYSDTLIAKPSATNESRTIIRDEFILKPDNETDFEPNNNNNNLVIIPNKQDIYEDKCNCIYQYENLKKSKYELPDILDYVKTGVEAIIEDEVTTHFQSVDLQHWNLLTRTNKNYIFINWKITTAWIVGFIFRYLFLFPLRCIALFILFPWILTSSTMISFIPNGQFKKRITKCFFNTFFSMCVASGAVVNHHNVDDIPETGICVANHTSPIDCIAISYRNYYSMVGQKYNGILGFLQTAFNKISIHIWFERDEIKDRRKVTERMQQHISDLNNPPIVIFPEGVVTNNTVILQFKKGCFEVGDVIYPIAIKYDPRFGDPYWNRSKQSMLWYLFMLMTSWIVVCDVWFLPSMVLNPGENSAQFANRVRKAIAQQAGLADLEWDGRVKNKGIKPIWKEIEKKKFSQKLKL